jgi:chromosome segregation ATPase
LQELVYKNGQAGVVRASVSITFDNRDKPNSPPGYDQHDEIVIQRQASFSRQKRHFFFFFYGPPKVPRCRRSFGKVRPLI